MLRFQPLDDFGTVIQVSEPIRDTKCAKDLIAQYVAYVSARPAKQTMYVRVDPGVEVSWEHMAQIYCSIRQFHQKYNLVDAVNVYSPDKKTVRWARCLLHMFSSNTTIHIHHALPEDLPKTGHPS